MAPPYTYKTVTGTYKDPDGTNVAGSVRFIPSTTVTDTAGNVVVPPTPQTVVLSSGAFSLDLLCTDDSNTNPTGWVWQVKELFSGGREWEFALSTAHPSTVDLSDLTPATTVDETYTYATLATVAALDARVTAAEGTVADAEAAAAASAVSASDSADAAAASASLATTLYNDLRVAVLMGAV